MFVIFSMIPHFSSIGYLAWRPYACYIKTNSVMRVISGSFLVVILRIKSRVLWNVAIMKLEILDITLMIEYVLHECCVPLLSAVYFYNTLDFSLRWRFVFLFFSFFFQNIVLVIFTFFFYVSRDFPTWIILHACCIKNIYVYHN